MRKRMNLMEFDKNLEYIALRYNGKKKHIKRISTEYPIYYICITNKNGLKKTEDYIYLSEHDLEFLR